MSLGMRTNYPHHLPAFDYTGFHRYFLTFCTEKRVRIFVIDEAVNLVWTQFLRAAGGESMAILACVFMPDHVHLIAEGEEEDSDLKRFISRAKQFSGYHYMQTKGARLWQRYGYEHVLRDEELTRSAMAYVLENPVRAKLVETVWDHPYIRSSKYEREHLIEYVYSSG